MSHANEANDAAAHEPGSVETDVEIEDVDDLFLEIDDDGEVTEADDADASADEPVDEAAEAIAALEAERDDLKERLLRKAADLENARRRHQTERDNLQKYAAESVLKDMVAVLDDLDRALEHLSKSADGDDRATTILEGVSMVQRKFVQTLERRQVRGFDSAGQLFDPNLHEAIQQVPDETVPHNTVVQEFQRGYMLADRLLRPALVVVGQGGAAAADAAASNVDAEPLESAASTDDTGEEC